MDKTMIILCIIMDTYIELDDRQIRFLEYCREGKYRQCSLCVTADDDMYHFYLQNCQRYHEISPLKVFGRELVADGAYRSALDFCLSEHFAIFITTPDFELWMLSPVALIPAFACIYLYQRFRYIPKLAYDVSTVDVHDLDIFMGWGFKLEYLAGFSWIDSSLDQVALFLRNQQFLNNKIVVELLTEFSGAFTPSKYHRLRFLLKLGYNPFETYDEITLSTLQTFIGDAPMSELPNIDKLLTPIVNERNDINTIFNPWDTRSERERIQYIMIHQSIIPGLKLLPIELMRLIFGHVRYVPNLI